MVTATNRANRNPGTAGIEHLIFDTRRKIRRALAAKSYTEERKSGGAAMSEFEDFTGLLLAAANG
jgi:hypothetical protein